MLWISCLHLHPRLRPKSHELIPEQPSISPLDTCKNAMSETVKEKFDRDRDLQAYIEKLPELLTSVQKLATKAPLVEAGGFGLTDPQLGPL